MHQGLRALPRHRASSACLAGFGGLRLLFSPWRDAESERPLVILLSLGWLGLAAVLWGRASRRRSLGVDRERTPGWLTYPRRGVQERGPLEIREDDPTHERIVRFLRNHLEHMIEITPPGSVHALDAQALRAPDITFWAAWEGAELLGCGALRELDSSSGELKSMCTAETHRGRGIASRMLEHIIEEAERRAYDRLYLETGAMPEFAPARSLYLRYGFEYRGPFAEYVDDPNSVFMTRALWRGGPAAR